ncbi:gluconokinase [Methylobacterium sp. W2]|uniref:gluconokinase n=1 Tax=Methylobacterium sp. W2 TaxID=2598107 RepID=UPI001D0C313A|nr:gluconokinase [Methylobacterium sp. W2]MCC0807322.1 gluconokinase [Methylobacterium sp. W2]
MPDIIVVMGVSGSGKSTVAGLLAERLGWDFVDGDSFHSPDHVAKMRDGHGLDDSDRAPWLAAMAAWIGACIETGRPGILACSALKRAYRDALVQGRAGIRIVYLDGDRDLIAARIARRAGHFMPAALLDSQFALLEPPGPEEGALEVPIAGNAEAIVATILTELGLPSDD